MADIDFYYPFDSIDGDRKTTAATERRFFDALFADGVAGAGGFPISLVSEGVYTIGAGVAIVGGAIGGVVNEKQITAKPAAGVTAYIVLRLDTTSTVRKITLEVVTSVASATAAQLDEGGVHDLILYSVTGQTGGGYGLLDQRTYATSFDAKHWQDHVNSQVSGLINDGNSQVDAMVSEFDAAIADANAEIAGLYGAAGRQGFINPTFVVNQRGKASYGLTSGSAYTYDRWKAVVSGRALSEAMTLQTAQYGARHALRIDAKTFATGTATVGRAGVVQNIEGGVRTFCEGNRSFTVSFDAKATAACRLGVEAKQIRESGGAGTDQVSMVNLTTEWQRFSVTFLGTSGLEAEQLSDVLQIGFYWSFTGYTRYGDDQDAANTIYLANMQINEGTAALPCYVKPYGEELEACQRYYAAFGLVSLSVGATLATSNQVISSPLPLSRRLYRQPDVSFTDRTGAAGVASVEVAAGGWRNGLTCVVSGNSVDNPVFVVTNTDSAAVTRINFNSVAVNAEIDD